MERRIVHMLTKEKESYKAATNQIEFCKVVRKVDKCTTFELINQDTGKFLLAATCRNSLTGEFVFTTLSNLHTRPFHEVTRFKNRLCAIYLGALKPYYGGLKFTIYDYDDCILAKIR